MVNVDGVEVIMAPPVDYVVNFANPPQIGKTEIFSVIIVENILALAFLFQRLYTKIVLLQKFQIEDGEEINKPFCDQRDFGSATNDGRKPATVIFAWATSVGTQAELMQLYVVKAVGVHAYEMPLERYRYFSRVCISWGKENAYGQLIWTNTATTKLGHLCSTLGLHPHRCISQGNPVPLLPAVVTIHNVSNLRMDHHVSLCGLVHGHLL